MRRLALAGIVLTAACVAPAAARVERVEILSRQPFAAGAEFGPAGAYEKLRGRAFFALDPDAVANAPIADLKLAPRNQRGLVEFSADFLMLRPVDPARRNGTLLYEVNNRGNIAILRQLNEASLSNDPNSTADAGNGFLFRQGFTLLWSAWAADVAAMPGDNRLVLRAPIATKDGAPITGKVGVRADRRICPPRRPVSPGFSAPLIRRRATARRMPRSPSAIGRTASAGRSRAVPLGRSSRRARVWSQPRSGSTAASSPGASISSPTRRVIRSWLRSEWRASAICCRICATIRWRERRRRAKTAIFGISQSGRLIQTMLLRGLHVDEDGRPAFDGAFIHVAGGGKGGFDYRFAMPTRHFSVLEDHIYPTDFFPFAAVTARDAVTGAEGSVLDRARALGVVPKLFYVNNSSEYWNRAASLIGTDPEGLRDLPPAPEARIYLIAGAQHYVGGLRERGMFTNCVNTLNHYRAMRALMVAFDRWVRDGVEPPPSAYPRIADGTLVTAAAYKEAFPRIPNIRLPESNLRPPRLDFGSRFETERIADQVPPTIGKPFEALVPKPDADGLDQGGIMLPEMLVPLGTRLGFNTRNDAVGFPWATGRWDGSFVPFPRTEAERRASGDPRPSLEARYRDRSDYEAKLRAAAAAVVGQGFLLPEDVDALVRDGGGLYDRVMAHDPADRSCQYMFGR